MDYGLYRYDEPSARPVRRRINYFAWTVAILLLTGYAFAAWLGSFYIFSQPERPDSYRILQKLHKIEPPKRFELTAAPAGEFLSAKQIYDRLRGFDPWPGAYTAFRGQPLAITRAVPAEAATPEPFADAPLLPIDLPTALSLANASNPTIAIARERRRMIDTARCGVI